MSRRKPDQDDEDWFHLVRSSHQRSNVALRNERPEHVSIKLRSFMLPVVQFTVLVAIFFVCAGSEVLRAEGPDLGIYVRAVEYCRGNAKSPMTLDLDKRVLCFDGAISPGQDVSLAMSLEENGIFVVRSPGGDVATAVALADLLQDRRATVVVHDYCLLACASYLLFASAKTIVLKESLVAWRYSNEPPWCPSLVVPRDDGPKRLEVAPCSDAPTEYQGGYAEFRNLSRKFYAERTIDPLAEWPPESFVIRRILKSRFEGTGRFPDAFWTWNPRYYATSIKTKVIYEAYPRSQSEVDAMASKLGLPRVLYDP